jgi:galactofuranosylgalactofuranosylrhamnosyl-N-acetylglucosaminyl-diphospho-decaprenol beta-1,5/1,6-galactofuranosyltransferase
MLSILQSCRLSLISEHIGEPFFIRHTNKYQGQPGLAAAPVWSFDTLFGAFPIETWRNHTKVRRVGIRPSGGDVSRICVMYRPAGAPPVVYRSEADTEANILWFDVPDDGAGIIYPIVVKPEDGDPSKCPVEIQYVTELSPCHDVRLAIVIPTYRREAQVTFNAHRIAEHGAAVSCHDMKVFIVDNGNTLDAGNFSNWPMISVLPNRNIGGAGGFARGMYEAWHAAEGFTHILMCDDDADICPESIVRAAAFLSFCVEDTYLGGTMLYQHDPCCVHESGASVSGPYQFKSNKQGLRVTAPGDLTLMDMEEKIGYFGWYMVAYPISLLERHGLPQPFFIRFDDQEFGLRLISRGVRPATLLGVCVWHEAFHLRDSQVTHYYLARNGIVALMLHRPDVTSARMTKQLFREFAFSILTLRYERGEFILKGVADAMKGPEFIGTLDAEKFNGQLIAEQKDKVSLQNYNALDGKLFDPPTVTNSRLRWLLVFLTFGGHLLPPFLTWRDSFDYINAATPAAAIRCRRIFYYEPLTKLGWVARRDRIRFFRLLMKALWIFPRFAVTAATLARRYQRVEQETVSRTAWVARFDA